MTAVWFYAAKRLGSKIEPVEIKGFSLMFVTLDGKERRLREAVSETFQPTWEGARNWLLQRAEEDLERIQSELHYAERLAENIRGLTCKD